MADCQRCSACVLLAMPYQKADHTADDSGHGHGLPWVVMNVVVGDRGHILGGFGNAILHVADATWRVGFLVCFVCAFHNYSFSFPALILRGEIESWTSAQSPIARRIKTAKKYL